MNRKSSLALLVIVSAFLAWSCSQPGNNKNTMENKGASTFAKGSYGFDLDFFKRNNIKTLELSDTESGARVMLIPAYQGRVMTSTSRGLGGTSYGWINHKLIESGEISSQFNPFGGEERFWFGPEGGPFSVYFKEGEEQVFENWKVPPVIDTEEFDIFGINEKSVSFRKETLLENASGTAFNVVIDRTISLISPGKLSELLGADFSKGGLDIVAYQSENTITNSGEKAWEKESGLLSVWMLCMFSPSPSTTVFIPYKEEGQGTIVNDEYFGKVPSDRLVVDSGTVYFKIDGALRSKIGIPPERARELCGSYDSERNILTLVWGSLPGETKPYVNSQWGDQDDPYAGDAVNSYNDGPVEDGSIMGPFYEIETSSPGAELQPGESLTHIQRVIHIQGDRDELDTLVGSLFGLSLEKISSVFS
jgi:hypothetical protein